MALGLGLLFLASQPTMATVGEPAFDEYEVKAAYLYNLAKFVVWPDSALPSPESNFVIAILGPDPFGPEIDHLLLNRSANGHKIRLERADALEQLGRCHILFLSPALEAKAGAILEQLKGQPVLTVSDIAGFGERGGMFTFYLEAQSVRLEVNQTAAQQAGLQLSAKLLSVAASRKR